MRFAPEYVMHVLNENFEDAKTLFLYPLVAIHQAHLVMLAGTGIITREEARDLRDALRGLPLADIRVAPYDSTSEDLFFYVERLIAEACGPDVAGRLHTARSRNDVDMTMYRMRQRDFLLSLLDATIELRSALLDLAERHVDTLFAAHTHTQPAQPSTVAHYLLAIIEQLERDGVRLRAAYGSINRCPLGACVITGTGFPIDRDMTSDLLGFSAPTGNTYGSIGAVDDMLEGVSAAAVALVGVGRFVHDLLLWSTAEFAYVRLADGFVQGSSIMPQKRNPVALEHARAIASKAVGEASAIVLAVHNTPFGDIVDTEDDLQPLVRTMYHDADRAIRLVAAVMAGAEFDVDALASQAAAHGTTLTELADHLAREHRLPFRTAHAVVARIAEAQRDGGAISLAGMLADATGDLLGTRIQYTDEQIATILSARHFVEVRQTHGGPAPGQVARALTRSRGRLDADRADRVAARNSLAAAAERLRARLDQL